MSGSNRHPRTGAYGCLIRVIHTLYEYAKSWRNRAGLLSGSQPQGCLKVLAVVRCTWWFGG